MVEIKTTIESNPKSFGSQLTGKLRATFNTPQGRWYKDPISFEWHEDDVTILLVVMEATIRKMISEDDKWSIGMEV